MIAKIGKLDTLHLEEEAGLKSSTSSTHYGMRNHRNKQMVLGHRILLHSHELLSKIQNLLRQQQQQFHQAEVQSLLELLIHQHLTQMQNNHQDAEH